MKNFSKITFTIVLTLFIIPRVTFAAWWNPATWFNNWSFTHKIETTETISPQEVSDQNQEKVSNNLPVKSAPIQANTKTTSQSNPFQVKDNINSGVIDENTNVVLNLSFNGKLESDYNVSFKLVRDTDGRTLSIEPGINFEYLLKNGGVYKPDMKRFVGTISYGQTSTTTYHVQIDVIKIVQTIVNPTTVKMENSVLFSAKSSKFKITTKPAIKSTVSITSPNTQSVLQIGQSYDITWTGSAPELASYGAYLNNSSLGWDNRTYLGSVNSSQQRFTFKVSQNIAPSLYRIQFLDGDKVFAYSTLFTITNNPNYTTGSNQEIDVEAAAQARLRRDQLTQARDEQINKENNCPAEGAKFLNLFIANKGQFSTDTSHFFFDKIVGQPEYHYNKSLSTCLIKLTHTISPASATTFVSQIRDVYSTKLVTYGTWSSEKDLGVHPNQGEFETEARSLMTE